MLNLLKRTITKSWRIIASPKIVKLHPLFPSKLYLKCKFRADLDCKLDLKHPQTYNEKLQWLKLNDYQPHYTQMVDKYEAKKYVADRIGEEYIIKTLGIWDSFNDIDFEKLPEQFVLKCTHDSCSNVICKNKENFSKEEAARKIQSCLSRNFYYSGRELPYKNVKRRIIAEEYLEDDRYHELRDYKFFTFGGVPKVVHIVSNRQNANEETYGDFFDMEYNHLALKMGHENAPVIPEQPIHFEKMKELTAVLAEGTRHLRVDFYEVNGKVYFGELTFYQDSGFGDIQPPEWNKTLGSWIDLS